MRPSNKQRSRNKSGGNQQRRNQMGNIVNRVFESAGPDGKVRGTPQQIIDKYEALARDAQVSGDRVQAESYLQFAEHYSRLLVEAQRQNQESRPNERDDRDDDRDARQGGGPQDRQQQDRQQQGGQQHGGQQQDRQGGQQHQPEPAQERQQGGQQQPGGDRPNGQHRERRRASAEPAALATFGDDDQQREGGPVDTPESAGWTRTEEPASEAPRQPEPAAAEAAAPNGAAAGEAAEAPAPKRTRARRKTKPAAEVIEASAD